MFYRLTKLLFISFMILLFTACGGGGGGNDAPTEENTTTPNVEENTTTPNVAPTFENNATVTVAENQNSAITLSASDDDNDSLMFSISGTDVDSFNISDGVVTFKTAPDFESGKTSYSFIATVKDGVNEINQSVIININNLNDNAPIFTSDNNVTVDENQNGAITLSATDADTNSITYSISGVDSDSFDIDSNTGVVTFKVSPDFETKTSYTFTATASDGINETNQSITINVDDVVELVPFLYDSSLSILENSPESTYVGTIRNGGADATSFTLDDNSSFVIDSNGVIRVALGATLDYETQDLYSLIAYATNNQGDSNSVSVDIGVVNINKPILITRPIYSVDSNISFEVRGDVNSSLLVNDVDINHTFDANSSIVEIKKDGLNSFDLRLQDSLDNIGELVNFTLFDTLDIDINDTLSSEIASVSRIGKYAKYYSFSIDSNKTIHIDLSSSFDTYLYLLNGSRDPNYLYKNDDGNDGTNSTLEVTLSEGNYTIEATSVLDSTTGAFDLSIRDITR